MATTFNQNDDSVVVIIGSGAGGGTLGNELAQKGINVVVLEAGERHEYDDFVNDEWASFTQLAWKDPRTTSGSWRVSKDFPTLLAWVVKAAGGSPPHGAGASPPALTIHAGSVGKSFDTRQLPEVVRGSFHANWVKLAHSSLTKSSYSCRSPASSTTTLMPFCASSLPSVPPPAPEPMITTTLSSFWLNVVAISNLPLQVLL